jgi:hypothetical protein
MKSLETQIVIQAPVATVWRLLTDFPSYASWNPFVVGISGDLSVGAKLQVRVQLSGSSGMTLKPRLLAAAPERELRWRGSLVVPGLFDGEHHFRLKPAGEQQVRFLHGETFSGLLVPLVWNRIAERTRQGFEAMNAALKKRAEAAF